jgi:hypothetical protein
MKNKNKLSIVIPTRNDYYIENFLNRLEFSINYFLYNTDKLKLLQNIEFIVVDWGSKNKISQEFSVIKKKYINKIFFLELSTEEAIKNSKNILGNFFTEKANNLGIVNSSGSHVMLCQHDTIFSLNSIKNIFSLIKDEKLNKKFVWIPRKYLNYQFYSSNPDFYSMDNYLEKIFFSKIKFQNIQMQHGGGAAAYIFKKENFVKIDFLDEKSITKGYFSGSDAELLKRASINFDHIDSSGFGITAFKLPRFELRGTKIGYIKKLQKNNYDFEYSYDSYKKNKNYKSIKYSIKNCKKIQKIIKLKSSKNYDDCLNLINIIRIFWHTIFPIKKLTNFINLFRMLNLIRDIPIYNYIELGSNYCSKIPYISKMFKYIDIYSLNLQRKKENILKTNFYIKLNRYLNRSHDGYYRFIYSSKIKNLILFFIENNFYKLNSIIVLNLDEFKLKELNKLLNIIKNKAKFLGGIIIEGVIEQKIIDHFVSSIHIKKNFLYFNISQNSFFLINYKINNVKDIIKKLENFNLSINLFYFFLSKFVYFFSIIKKLIYHAKKILKSFNL